MAFGEHKAVAVRVFGIVGVHMHFAVIKPHQRLGDGQRTARVTRMRMVYALDHAHAHFARINGQFFFRIGIQH